MAALTQPRATNPWGAMPKPLQYGPYPMKASTTIYTGALVGIDSSASGLATNMATGSTTLICVGVAPFVYENQAPSGLDAYVDTRWVDPLGTGAAGNLSIDVFQGLFPFFNGATLITNANIGTSCYANDNQTVSTTSASQSKVGVITLVDAGTGLVWVAIDPFAGRP